MEKMTDLQCLCAHRGAHKGVAPENSIPAFQKALELGAPEIEIDLWPSKDGEMFVFHNSTVECITGQKTLISNMTSKEIKALDIGSRFSTELKGLQIPTFEEVLDLTANKTILNIHIKSLYANAIKTDRIKKRSQDTHHWYTDNVPWLPPLPDGIEDVDMDVENRPIVPYERKDFARILKLLDKYQCRENVYIAGEREVLMIAQEMAPDIERCCLEAMNFMTVEVALRYDCKRVQFNKGMTTKKMLDTAHAHGMKCNMFWSNIGYEACAYLDAGIDCILTDEYEAVSEAVKLHLASKQAR